MHISHSRKTLLLGIPLTSALFLGGCSFQDISNMIISEEDKAKNEMYAVIETANAYIEYGNATNDAVGGVYEYLQDWESDKKSSVFPTGAGCWSIEPNFYFSSYQTTLESLEEQMMIFPSRISEADKAYLQENGGKLIKAFRKTYDTCLELHKYLDADEYKVDNFAKGDEYVATAQKGSDDFYAVFDSVQNKIKEIQDANDPHKDSQEPYHVATRSMENTLEGAEKILTELQQFTDGSDISPIETLLNALITQVDNAQTNKPKLSTTQHQELTLSTMYDGFFKGIEDRFIADVKKAINNYKAGDSNSFYRSIESVLQSYNFLVDLYNRSIGL